MSLYLSVGNELLLPEEITESALTGELDRIKGEGKRVSLFGLPGGKKTKFTPVGPGKPLSIEIREIFTGDLPNPGLFGLDREQDLLVTTSYKPITQMAAASRAVNLVREKVARKAYFKDVAATEVGTPIVYYSPAVVEASISLTVELGFENFSRQVLDTLSGAFQTAAKIPLFVTKSMWLLAGSMVTKLLADLGKAIFEKGPEFVGTGRINFNRAGIADTAAGYGVLFSADTPPQVSEGYHIDEDGVLVGKHTGNRYDEKYPYVILSIDGAKNPSYEDFQQSTASAELLVRFYNIGENRTQPIDELLKGLRYYSDMNFRHEAAKLDGQIKDFRGEGEELEKLKERRKALIANILTEELKP
jgi:hypothetical protein